MAFFTIHRGSGEIGGCASELRAGDHRIIIDFGKSLPGSRGIGDEALVHHVFGAGERPDAVLFTHYHGDHIGLYRRIPPEVPLYIGPTAKKLLELLTERLDRIRDTEEPPGLPIIRAMGTYRPGIPLLPFGNLRVTPLLTDHSALDAYMFLVEAEGVRLLYTGDFREHGVAGERDRLARTLQQYAGQVDVLVTEGTTLSRRPEELRNIVRTEAELRTKAAALFRKNRQSAVLVSSMNLDSVMAFFHAVPPDRAFVCDAYQARLLLTAMAEKGRWYPQYRRPMIGRVERPIYILGDMEGLGPEQGCRPARIKPLREKGFVLLARENHNPKIEKNQFERFMEKYMEDPLIIYSKWAGYLDRAHGGFREETADPAVNRFLGDRRMVQLHTGGHAGVETLQKVLRLTNPRAIIPMHTEYAEGFSQMPEFAEYRDRVVRLRDGVAFDLAALK